MPSRGEAWASRGVDTRLSGVICNRFATTTRGRPGGGDVAPGKVRGVAPEERPRLGGGRQEADRDPARAGETDGEGAGRTASRPEHLRRAGPVRPAPLRRLRDGEVPR